MPFTPLRRVLAVAVALGIATTALVAAPVFAPAPAAHAATGGGSIVYIKKYNVWIADGDGRVQRQITRGGTKAAPWQSPTQSDAGVVVAHRGGVIYRMNQRGELFNAFHPPKLFDSIGHTLSGRDLTETAVSPDGSRIAYTYAKYSLGKQRWATAFTASDRITDPMKWDIAFYDKPSWVTNSRVVLNNWTRLDSHLVDLGRRDIPWFSERFYNPDPKELSDLEVSRDGRWTVGVRGDTGDQTIIVIRNEGDVQTSASPWKPVFGKTNPCELGLADRNLREPTLAPDGSTLAWAEPGGIYRASDMNCDSGTRLDILVAAGGSDPSWSKAAIGTTPAVKHLRMKKKPTVSGTARVGKTLRVSRGTWSPAPISTSYRWTRDGKAIAGATKTRYQLKKRDRGHRIAVSVTVRGAGYYTSTQKRTASVRVR